MAASFFLADIADNPPSPGPTWYGHSSPRGGVIFRSEERPLPTYAGGAGFLITWRGVASIRSAKAPQKTCCTTNGLHFHVSFGVFWRFSFGLVLFCSYRLRHSSLSCNGREGAEKKTKMANEASFCPSADREEFPAFTSMLFSSWYSTRVGD